MESYSEFIRYQNMNINCKNVVELRYKCDNRLAAVESESMSKLRTLEKAMEEVRVFNTFYQGLEEGCDDALLLTDEQLVEVLEEDHLYECFAEFYNGTVGPSWLTKGLLFTVDFIIGKYM